MDGKMRRKRILQLLSEQTKPLSGTALAKQFGVSRQVIVQDIALLKSKEPAIISTYRGYVLGRPERVCERVFWVRSKYRMNSTPSLITVVRFAL